MSENSDNKIDLDPSDDEELVKLAKRRFDIAAEFESESRRNELDDLEFMVSEQWPDDIRQSRMMDQRPCLTINKLPQFVRQITNDQRQNRPSIKVNPCDSKADGDTAKILQGMIRHIEYNSHSDIAYDTAFESAVISGIGYYRIVTDYSNPMSFQQEILIKRIKDRFSVYLDPYYQEPDGSDAQWGFVFEDMSDDEYKAQYPKSKLSSMSDWASIGDDTGGIFIKPKSCRIAEYYYKVWVEEEIVLLSDETVVLKSSLPDKLEDGLKITSERKTLVPKIRWAKINGVEVLDRTDIPGMWIPIIPVIGEEFIVDGKRILSGIVRNAKDSQRMYNYWASSETEMIALAPKAPYIGAEGQFEGYEDKWKTANTKNHSYLEYKPTSLGGITAPAPVRTQFDPQVQAITQARMSSNDDLKSTTGIYDASLGNRSNEQSGVAIQRRNSQAQTSNFHFIDNLSRSIRHTGRICINWIPQIYKTAQAVRVIGDDGEVKMEEINQVIEDKQGQDSGYFLDAGTYDCTVDTGPSFQTKRQESVASMLDLARSLPNAMQVALDLLVRNMDWPGASEIADRIKKSLPPNITQDDEDQAPLPPQVQQQMQQMSAMIKQLSQHLDENTKIIEQKKIESDSKERISAMDNETAIKIELIKHNAKDGQLAFVEEMKEIQAVRARTLQDQQNISGAGNAYMGQQDPNGQAAPPMQSQQPAGGSQPAAMGAPQ